MFEKNNLKIYNGDNMELMKNYSDNYFDLAIVDPPYGIKYGRGKNAYGNTIKNMPTKKDVKWDIVPKIGYFRELKRVSKNQIIWGGNYFTDKLSVSKCWIVWDKKGDLKLNNPFADCELAYTSFSKVVKKFTFKSMGFIKETKDKNRIHPTQKPTELYEWLLENYADKDFKILDTHLGSGSSAIAAYYFGCKEFVGIEIDEDYFNDSIKRIKQQTSQIKLL